jgi:hypothetical protein
MPQESKARGSASKAKGNSSGAGAPQKSQSERFIETARMLGVDESGKEFDRALKKIVPAKNAADKAAKRGRAKSS